jgi:intein-encoded DNA endonuclease-like protein
MKYARKLKTEPERQEVIAYYQSGYSVQKTADKFNVSISLVDYVLKDYNILKRRKKYSFDEDFFENIDSEIKAYYLGLIVADGSVRKGNVFALSLESVDAYLVEKLKETVNYTGVIYKSVYKTGIMHILCMTSEKMCIDLSKYGVVKNKTHVTFFPNIPEELHHHFIRGVFDGDGSITTNVMISCSFDMTGNIDLISKIKSILEDKCDLNNIKYSLKTNCDNIKTISYGGTRQLCRIREYLYKDATIYMQRKQVKMFSVVEYSEPPMGNCTVCGKPATTRTGLCKSHYEKQRIKNKL